MRLLRVAAVLLAVALVSAPAAGAQESAQQQQRRDELGLSVAVGFDGRSREGTWQPVSVGLEPIRPVAGTLSVTAQESSTTQRLDVEVAAGSRKVYRFVVPSTQIEVTFSEDGADPLTVRPAGDPVTGEYLVGLLGGGGDNLPPLRSEFTGRSGAWVTLDPAWFEVSPQALEPLAAVVAKVGDLETLSPKALANLGSTVAAGMDLVAVGHENSDLAALRLPLDLSTEPWQVTSDDISSDTRGAGPAGVLATAVPALAGRVVVTDIVPGQPGFGQSQEFWSLLAQPSARGGVGAGDYRVTSTPHQFARLLANSDGETPTLPGLGAFVLVYVLVVGPINGIILARMGRRELAWVTVPLITVIFTIGAFVGATTARPESGGATQLTYWADEAGTQVVAAGVRAPTPGTRTVTFPGSDWTVRPLVDGSNPASVIRADDVTVAMDLTALQLGGVAAWRSVTTPAPLEVQAVGGAKGVDVTVRNTSGRTLSDVTARVATTSRSVGSLAPGARETVTIASTRLPAGSAYGDPFEGLMLDENGSVAAPVSMRAVLNTEVAQGRPGTVWVSGVDTQGAVDVTSGGQALRDRGSIVAVGAQVDMASKGLSPFAVSRDAMYDPRSTYPVGASAVEGDGEVFLRFRLPPGTAAAQLSNELERGQESKGGTQLTVWDVPRRQWVPLGQGFDDPRRLIGPLGEVWVRASGQMFPFEYAGRTVAGVAP